MRDGGAAGAGPARTAPAEWPHPDAPHADRLLHAALRSAPRRYRLPPLPPHAMHDRAETALAAAIEAARLAVQGRTRPPEETAGRFTAALAQLLRQALDPQRGDPAFQALVLRGRDPQVAEYVRLCADAPADRRVVRTLVDAIAHPGKLRGTPAGTRRDALLKLHGAAQAGAWKDLPPAIAALLAEPGEDGAASLGGPLRALASHAALQRLQRRDALLAVDGVQRYRLLCERQGPRAGTGAAAERGRRSGRAGEAAEAATVEAFRSIAQLLQRASDGWRYHVVRSLRPPGGFPGARGKAKDEWDAAIVRTAAGDAAADIVLLAEVKASPAAATPDLLRLVRGLQRLAHASADATYAFASADGEVLLRAGALRSLRPEGHALPANVIYCCSADAEQQPQMLSAATRAALLAEPASVSFADAIATGATPPHQALRPVWDALLAAPRLRSALHQWETAQAVREAMLHPDDLLAAVARLAEAGGRTTPRIR